VTGLDPELEIPALQAAVDTIDSVLPYDLHG